MSCVRSDMKARMRVVINTSHDQRDARHMPPAPIESFTICVQLDREQRGDRLCSQPCSLFTEVNVNRAHHPAL